MQSPLSTVQKYRTGLLLGACAYTSTGKKFVLIHEMHLIKSAFFNAGILGTAAKYAPNNVPVRHVFWRTRSLLQLCACIVSRNFMEQQQQCTGYVFHRTLVL